MSKQRLSVLDDDGILICGYYKKLKTMKKKYFVLYNETPCKVARIEYYDNEKKYKSGFTPKRIIKIKNCFNINRRFYTKHDFVIVLASTEGGFGIVMESEDDMNTWLNHLLHLQRSGETAFDFPKFDYVWQVVIQKKGIAEQHNIFGSYHICLTNKSVTFIKIGREKNVGDKKITKIEVLLTTIRRCGDSQCYFYMEIGRQSSLGPGELWMETEDSLTAQNMHRMILSKMISLNEALVEPMRKRSSSATETTNLHHDRKSSQNLDITSNYLLNAQNFSRDRCDSLPSRNRTSSECSNHSIRMKPITSNNRVMNLHISNTSPVVYSASEESVSVDDSEDSIGMPYLSSRSPEGVILEEYIDDVLHSQKFNEYSDMNSVLTLSSIPGSKANINPIKQDGPAIVTDIKKDICGNIDDQLQFSVRAYSFGGKDESDLTKESMVNRVRAFSVGSRIKSTRICSKSSFKFNSDNINNDFVESSTRKSISVPVLINRHLQATDRMGDLMEIDFSKSIDKTLNKNIQHNKNECQNVSNMLPRSLNISNSIESVGRSIKSVNNGYLEMKPITLASSSIIYNGNNPVNNTGVHSQNQHNFEQNDISIDSTALTDTKDGITPVSTKKVTNYHNIPDKGIHPTDYEGKIKMCTSIPINQLTLSSECSNNFSDKNFSNVIKLPQVDTSSMKQQDLYYASLDLPKCGNEVNTRYSFKESLSDTNIGEIKNEYAKINFDKPETSCSLREEKTLSFQ